MQYPKPIMTLKEMIQLGFSENFLRQMAHRKGQNYCRTTPGGGKFMFDTKKFEEEMQKMLVR